MHKFLGLLLLMFIISFSGNSFARPGFGDKDPEFLVNACRAVTLIYNARDEKRWLASQTTSLSDALRAGYCLGVLEQFQCNNFIRQPGSLIELARRVAELESAELAQRRFTIERLLNENVCQ